MQLSTEQKVLLHISRFTGKESRWEAPYEVSQAGISASLHIPQSTASRALKSLKEKGLIYDRVMYVKGEKRKKSAYFPTEEGKNEAENLLKSLKDMPVDVDMDGEQRVMSISELERLYSENGNPIHPFEIYEVFRKEGIVRMRDKGYVRFHVPDIGGEFIGRKELMEDIEKSLHTTLGVLIKGMAGMGKSALLSKMAYRLSEKHHIFWYSFRKRQGYYELLKELNEFLMAIGKRPVERKLGAKGYFEELKKSNSVLILDDIHLIDERSREFIRELSDMMFSNPCDFRIISASREESSVFRKSELATGKLREIELMPLKKEELAELFHDELEEVYALTGGVPLFVQLYRNAGFRISDAERILDEEVLSSLSPEERGILEEASVHRVPVYQEAFSGNETLHSIMERFLIFDVGNGKLDMHDVIKDVIYRSVPAEKKRELHLKASKYYMSQWCDENDRFESVYHLCMAGEWERAAKTALSLSENLPLEYGDAVLMLRNGMEHIPEDMKGDVLVLIGDVLAQNERWDEAISYYDNARAYLGDVDEIQERMAQANIGMENWEESLSMENELLEKARKSKDKHEIAKHLLIIGNIYLRSGRYKEALNRYEESKDIISKLKYREGMAVVENNIGSALIHLGRLNEAEKHIMNAIDISKSKGRQAFTALSNLGYLYELKGNKGGAEKAYREAIKLARKGECVPILLRMLRLMVENGKWGETIATAKSWEEKVPEKDRWKILNIMADAYRKGRMYEEGIKVRKKALSHLNRTDVRLRLAEDLIFAGRMEEALEILNEEEKRVAPWEQEDMMYVFELKGRVLVLKGEKESAAENYMKAIRIAEELGDLESAERLRKVIDGL